MSEGSGDIIIKGGSISLHFDEYLFGRDPANPNKYSNSHMKIGRILIRDENGNEKFNSGDHPAGLKWTIEIGTK